MTICVEFSLVNFWSCTHCTLPLGPTNQCAALASDVRESPEIQSPNRQVLDLWSITVTNACIPLVHPGLFTVVCSQVYSATHRRM